MGAATGQQSQPPRPCANPPPPPGVRVGPTLSKGLVVDGGGIKLSRIRFGPGCFPFASKNVAQ